MSTGMAPIADPYSPVTLARAVLAMALCVWAGHYLLLSTLYYFLPDRPSDPGTLLARLIVSATGVSLCLGIYMLLRHRAGPRPWPLFFQAAGLSTISAAILVLVGKAAFLHLTSYYQQYPEQFFRPHETGWLFIGYLWMMLAWSALFVGATAIGEMRRRDAQLAVMREAAREARLLALRLQINPHFLFNTLNTLAGFIALDRKADSERIVLNLSRFFRHSLTRTASQLVPLGSEVDMLRVYLEIESARFRDRLRVSYEVPPECRVALVPSLILLPLAENSIRHALACSEDGIKVSIGARRDGGFLLVWLRDNGPPRDSSDRRPGAGLASTRQQLASLYGNVATLEAGSDADGWHNLIRLPWQESAP